MIDVDSTYDPDRDSVQNPGMKMTLDEHREIALKAIDQPGFGGKSEKARAKRDAAKQPQAVLAEEPSETVDE
jgi:hypothetical protein